MKSHKFYDEHSNEVAHPRRVHMRLDKDGQVLPKRDNKGRQILGFDMHMRPIVKLKFRKSMSVLSEINEQLRIVEKYTNQLEEFRTSWSDEIKAKIQSFKENHPDAAEMLEQLRTKDSEIWFYLGRWDGMRYVSGERFYWPTFKLMKKSIAAVKDWANRLECEMLPAGCMMLLQSMFA